jgi:hypothetical protein
MKRTILALAAAAGIGLLAGTAVADPGGFAPPGSMAVGSGGGGAYGQIGAPGTLIGAGDAVGRAPDRYGWNPLLKRFFRLGGGAGCATGPTGYEHGNALRNPANWPAAGYGMGGPAYNPGGFPPGAGTAPMQGTLAFPHHPLVRSPRDYFMMDLNK